MTEIERLLAQVNADVFLREYTFATNQFSSQAGGQRELADHVVLAPGAIIAIQAKERQPSADRSETAVTKWFDSKVLGKACGQLRDTEEFFQNEPHLVLPNQRGHVRDLTGPKAPVVKVALYAIEGLRPPGVVRVNHKISQRAGFVHVMHIRDYLEVCQILALPIEIAEYFLFREAFLRANVPCWLEEGRLLASFIAEDIGGRVTYSVARRLLEDARADRSFDLVNLLKKYGEKATYYDGEGSGTDYYSILDEFARMNRSEMRTFKELLDWGVTNAGSETLERPERMLLPDRSAGIIIFPVPASMYPNHRPGLQRITLAAKYDWRLNTQIGIAVARDDPDMQIDWAYAQFVWEPDARMEAVLSESYPFWPTPQPKLDYRYLAR
jgi:hypothetical protein